MKEKWVYVCQQCGQQYSKWMGRCQECNQWNSVVEERAVAKKTKGIVAESGEPLPVTDILSQTFARI